MLDPSFGDGGTVVTKIGTSSSAIYDLVLQPDGKILTVGPSGGFTFVTVARYRTDGNLDPTFGNNGIAIGPSGWVPYRLALQQDGKMVVAGASTDFCVARFNKDGSLDKTFGNAGEVKTDFFQFADYAYCVAVQNDGKIVVAGSAGQPGVGYWFTVVRYNSDGSLDSTFGAGGKSLNIFSDPRAYDVAVEDPSDILVQSDGKIVVVGYALGFPNLHDFVVVRYNVDGTLDSSFGNSGKVLTDFAGGGDFAAQVVLQPDGRLVVGGRVVFTSPMHFDFGLVRYNRDGSLDSTFGSNGKVVTDFANSYDRIWEVELQRDGRIVAGGETYNPRTGYDFVVARYNADGGTDTTFGDGGKVVRDFFGKWDTVYGLAIQADGKIVAGGLASSYAIDAGDCALARFDAGEIAGPEFKLDLSAAEINASRPDRVKVTVNINRSPGFTGAVTVVPPDPLVGLKPKPAEPRSTTDSSVSFKLKVKRSASPGTHYLNFTGKDDSGLARTVTLKLTVL